MLRLRTYHKPNTSSTYDAADKSGDTSTGTWTVDYTPLANTTTTLLTPTSAGPSRSRELGDVDLADVTDPSVPGTVQFQSGGANVGGPQTVTNGVATLTTTALPVGNPDSLTAVFTPDDGCRVSSVSPVHRLYVVTAGPSGAITVAKSTALIGNYPDKGIRHGLDTVT